MSESEKQMFLNASKYQKDSILDAIKQRKPELLQPKREECKWCPYRPMTQREEGCPFYNPLSEEVITI